MKALIITALVAISASIYPLRAAEPEPNKPTAEEEKMGVRAVTTIGAWRIREGTLKEAGAKSLGLDKFEDGKRLRYATQTLATGWTLGVLKIEGQYQDDARYYLQGPKSLPPGRTIHAKRKHSAEKSVKSVSMVVGPDGTIRIDGGFLAGTLSFKIAEETITFDLSRWDEVAERVVSNRTPSTTTPKEQKPQPPPR